MPAYDYQCSHCKKVYEETHAITDSTPNPCKLCGKGMLRKVFRAPAVKFNGSGFYVTDNK